MEHINTLLAKRMQGTQSSIVRQLLEYSKMPNILSLAGGIPAADMFDLEGINAALAVATSNGVDAYQYSLTDGEVGLRQGIVSLLEQRHIQADASEILVTSGSQQALDLVARVLLDPEDTILVERPTYLAAIQVFELCDANILDVAGDAAGLDPEVLEGLLKTQKIKALYVVPNFANPTGSTLPKARRLRLIELAEQYNFIIIEDDPYGALRFKNGHEPSIYQLALDQNITGRVVYLSSFSKILVPGLRVGFLAANSQLRKFFVTAKQAFDLHTPVLSQKIVEAYLASGRLKERVPLLCATYKKRCDLLMAAFRKHLGDEITFQEPDGGMFLWAKLKNDIDSAKLLECAIKAGVVFVPGEAFYVSAPDKSTIRLSFATISELEADEAGRRMAEAIKDYRSNNR